MIDLKNVSVTFKSDDNLVHAVKDVTLTVQRGEIYGVIGYSGAGKSTLVRTINMLQPPTSGHVIIDHTDLTTLNKKELRGARKKIGMIFQHFNLLSARTVAGNIAFPLKDSGLSKDEIQKKVDRLLSLVGLSERKDAYPSQLSGGQKQRVAIARALANDPDILLCDEATSALDPKTTHSILELIETVNRELNLTVVIITHEMAVVKQICDRVAVMENGHVIEEGSIFDIFTKPKQELTKNFIESASPTEKGIQNVLANPELVNIHPDDRVIRIDFSGAGTGEPLISTLAKKFDVLVNILYADVEILQKKPIGTILVALSGESERLDRALAFIQESNVSVIEYHQNAKPTQESTQP